MLTKETSAANGIMLCRAVWLRSLSAWPYRCRSLAEQPADICREGLSGLALRLAARPSRSAGRAVFPDRGTRLAPDFPTRYLKRRKNSRHFLVLADKNKEGESSPSDSGRSAKLERLKTRMTSVRVRIFFAAHRADEAQHRQTQAGKSLGAGPATHLRRHRNGFRQS